VDVLLHFVGLALGYVSALIFSIDAFLRGKPELRLSGGGIK